MSSPATVRLVMAWSGCARSIELLFRNQASCGLSIPAWSTYDVRQLGVCSVGAYLQPYRYWTTRTSKCLHSGHLKVRLSWSGRSCDSMRIIHIGLSHLGHAGVLIGGGECLLNCDLGIAHCPFVACAQIAPGVSQIRNAVRSIVIKDVV